MRSKKLPCRRVRGQVADYSSLKDRRRSLRRSCRSL